MDAENEKQVDPIPERSDAFWRRVYLLVIAVTFFVITGLWAFSRYFS